MELITNQEIQTAIEVVKPVINMATVKTGMKISKLFGRTGLKLQKHSPEILLGVGVVGIVGTVVLACRATLKAEAAVNRAQFKVDQIKLAKELNDEVEYSEKDYQKDMTVAYVQTAVDFIVLYGPAVTLGVASIACIVGSHGLMRKRNVALMAAYKTIEEGFKAYRNRVREEYGDEKDYMFKNNLYEEEITEEVTDENGKKKKVKKTQLISRDPVTGASIYARIFEKSTTREWSCADGYNLAYITGQQAFFNNMLQARGHVFLNEVYDALGFKRSKEGAMVGWVLNSDGDGYIDFGLNGNTWNGMPGDYLIDPNVDGVIYDLI